MASIIHLFFFSLVLFISTFSTSAIPIDCSLNNNGHAPFILGSTLNPDLNVDNITAICTDFSRSMPLGLGTSSSVRSPVYDSLYDMVYWVDSDDRIVYRGLSYLNHDNNQPCFKEAVLNDNQDMISIDSANRRLFWASSLTGTIGVADMDGSNSAVLYDTSSGAVNVNDIRFDPSSGLIFWGTSGTSGRVVSGSVNGGAYFEIYGNVGVHCIEVNNSTNTVYWMVASQTTATMQSANYDGSNVDTTFLTISIPFLLQVSDMVLHNEVFYVIIISLDLNAGSTSYDVFEVPEQKGSVAVNLELSMDFKYLFVEPGVIAPLETEILFPESFTEEEGTTITLQIRRTGNLFRCSQLKLTTVADTAKEGIDYVPFEIIMSFQPHVPTMNITMDILDNDDIPSNNVDKLFYVTLQNIGEFGDDSEPIVNAPVTIIDNEYLIYNLEEVEYLVKESTGIIVVNIGRTWNGSLPDFTEITLTSHSGTALAEEDFKPFTETIKFPSDSPNLGYGIVIVRDDKLETKETFDVEISAPSHGRIGDRFVAAITIEDECPDDYCENNGICKRNEEAGRFVCECGKLYVGRNCNGLSSNIIIGIACGIAGFIILTVVILIIVIKTCHKSKTENNRTSHQLETRVENIGSVKGTKL